MLFIDPTYYGTHNNSINFVNAAQLKIMKVEYYSFSRRSFHAYIQFWVHAQLILVKATCMYMYIIINATRFRCLYFLTWYTFQLWLNKAKIILQLWNGIMIWISGVIVLNAHSCRGVLIKDCLQRRIKQLKIIFGQISSVTTRIIVYTVVTKIVTRALVECHRYRYACRSQEFCTWISCHIWFIFLVSLCMLCMQIAQICLPVLYGHTVTQALLTMNVSVGIASGDSRINCCLSQYYRLHGA